MLLFFGGENGKFCVLRVRRGDVDRVTSGQYFGHAVRDPGIRGLRQLVSARSVDVVNRSDAHAVITRKDRCVHTRDVTGAEKTDFEFGHRKRPQINHMFICVICGLS